MESFLKITTTEALAYGKLKELLNMKTDEEFLKYMRVKTINQFKSIPNFIQKILTNIMTSISVPLVIPAQEIY